MNQLSIREESDKRRVTTMLAITSLTITMTHSIHSHYHYHSTRFNMRTVLLLLSSSLFSLAYSKPDYRTSGSVHTWNGTVKYDEDWDYFTVRAGVHTFWWLYAAASHNDERPLILWLQGGPGASAIGFGNFDTHGPKRLDGSDRESTWLQSADIVYVDNPVGSGFSYADNHTVLTTNVEQIGKDLLSWALLFFERHSEYRTRPFYIFCESYGGKMGVEFARVLLKSIASNQLELDFRGIALGDSWISSMDYMHSWGQYLYRNSYLDDAQLAAVEQQAGKCQWLVDWGRWEKATDCFGDIAELIDRFTEGISWYNILKHTEQDDWSRNMREKWWNQGPTVVQARDSLDQMNEYMNTVVRKKLGIIPRNVTFGAQAKDVFNALYDDFMKPNWKSVDGLLKQGLRVIIFNGQLDLICDTAGTEAWIRRLSWHGQSQYQKTPKKSFKTKHFNPAGYVKEYNNLSFFYVLRAGHMVS